MVPLKAVLLFLTLLFVMIRQGTISTDDTQTITDPILLSTQKFKQLYQNIGDSTITPDSAAVAFKTFFLDLKRLTLPAMAECQEDLKEGYVFPVRGYSPRSSIGGRPDSKQAAIVGEIGDFKSHILASNDSRHMPKARFERRADLREIRQIRGSARRFKPQRDGVVHGRERGKVLEYSIT